MPRPPRQLGRCWIALAALCAVMAWGSASASACETMRAASGVACRTACPCCKAETAAEAPRHAEIRPVAPAAARTCVAPAEDCCCRTAPAEAPPADNRRPVEPPRPRILPTGMLFAIVAHLAPASFGPPPSPRWAPPPATRLYLLNARFLI